MIHSYAALGDSFTAGTGCPPGARWPDRLAQALRAGERDLLYGNYAEKGATTARVLARQVPRANQIEPDLVIVVCGANDVLESVRPDVAAAAARLGEIFDRLREASPGAVLASATIPERWRFLGIGQRTRRRLVAGLAGLNEEIRSAAAARGIALLEAAGHPELDDPANFGPDGLHPSILGHRRAAEEMVRLLSDHLAGECLGAEE